MSSNDEKTTLSYSFHNLMEDLTSIREKILQYLPQIDAYLVVMKGGAIFISTLLQIMPPAPIYTIHFSSYTPDHKQKQLQQLTPFNFFDLNLRSSNILVIDDIYDSGLTLTQIEKLSHSFFNYHLNYWVLFQKRDTDLPLVSQYLSSPNKWIVFEWECEKLALNIENLTPEKLGIS